MFLLFPHYSMHKVIAYLICICVSAQFIPTRQMLVHAPASCLILKLQTLFCWCRLLRKFAYCDAGIQNTMNMTNRHKNINIFCRNQRHYRPTNIKSTKKWLKLKKKCSKYILKIIFKKYESMWGLSMCLPGPCLGCSWALGALRLAHRNSVR